MDDKLKALLVVANAKDTSKLHGDETLQVADVVVLIPHAEALCHHIEELNKRTHLMEGIEMRQALNNIKEVVGWLQEVVKVMEEEQ
jgi:hypothetical protein